MAHTVVNSMHCAFTNIDAYNLVGIATSDIDNGTFLTLSDMKLKDAEGGFEFGVSAASADSDLIAITPEVGYDLVSQIYDDPRYFTNKAGKPISVKRVVKGDVIEITIDGFTADPSTNGYAKVGTGGKLTATATTSDAWKILAESHIDIGGESVKSYILMKQ